MRYTKTQSLYLSRKGVLPEIVDLFGMAVDDSVTAMDEQAEAEEPVDRPRRSWPRRTRPRRRPRRRPRPLTTTRTTSTPSSGEQMPPEDEWEEPDPDSLMRSERKHEWISEPRYKRMFDDIEHALQGVMGKGPFEWVDRRVFDQVFDRSTLLALHKLMEKGEIETIDHPIARGKEAHVFRATSASGPSR